MHAQKHSLHRESCAIDSTLYSQLNITFFTLTDYLRPLHIFRWLQRPSNSLTFTEYSDDFACTSYSVSEVSQSNSRDISKMMHNSLLSISSLVYFIQYLSGNFVFLVNSLAKVNNNISAKLFGEKGNFFNQILKNKIDF